MAYSEGVERLFRDKELAMKVIGKYTKTTDRDAQDAAYGFATTFVERLPRLPYKAVETILAQIAEKDPRAKAHKPDDLSIRLSTTSWKKTASSKTRPGLRAVA
jgi:hypothetical protein